MDATLTGSAKALFHVQPVMALDETVVTALSLCTGRIFSTLKGTGRKEIKEKKKITKVTQLTVKPERHHMATPTCRPVMPSTSV